MNLKYFVLFFLFPFYCYSNADTIKIETEYWENGNLKTQKNYFELFKFTYTSWHSNGQLHIEGSEHPSSNFYVRNSWDALGNPMVKKGKGHHINFYENGIKKEEGEIFQGYKNGIWTEYFPSGVKKARGEYKEYSGRKYGLWTYWNESGKKVEEKECINDFCNYWNKWDEKSQLTIENGKGFLTTYHLNGQKESEGNLKNGKRIGDWKNWYPNGQLIATYNYIEKKHDHLGVVYRCNYLESWDSLGVQTAKDGTGWYFNLTSDGYLSKTYFTNNIRHGLSYRYFKDGTPHYVDTNSENDDLMHRIIYHSNGNKAYEAEYSGNFDFETKKSTEWYYDGQVSKEVTSTGGGSYKEVGYYKNGKVHFIGHCEEIQNVTGSNLKCKYDYWDKNGNPIEK